MSNNGRKFVCRMSRRINICAAVVLVLLELTTSAMVLPRPPSSHPNRIRQDQDLSARKALEGKSLHGVPARDINIDRPEDYRYYYRYLLFRRPCFCVLSFFISSHADRYRYYTPLLRSATVHFRSLGTLELVWNNPINSRRLLSIDCKLVLSWDVDAKSIFEKDRYVKISCKIQRTSLACITF